MLLIKFHKQKFRNESRWRSLFSRALLPTFFLLISEQALAHKGISFQVVLKRPDGNYPSASGVNVNLQVLDPITNCVLREEIHSGIIITNGYLNLVLGSPSATTPAGNNPSPVLTLSQVMDNATPRTGLTCLDASNGIVSTGSTYTPAESHARKLRITVPISGDTVIADFNMRAIGFAVNSENLGGKAADAFVQTSANATQSRIESIFSRYTILDSILNGTFAGNAATATTASALATAPGACGAGQYISAMTANGTITCGTPASGVGTVTSVTSANSYLSVATGTSTPVLTLNVGTAANTVAAGNDSRFTDARTPTGTAGGDLSGAYPNPTVAKIAGKSVVLTTPANGEFLKYDGTNFVNAAISTADATKLPLAGGTMSGAIDMGSQNLTNVGYVTMSANKNLHLSNNASDPAGLVAADKGKIWFNSTTGEIKYWNGSAAQSLGVAGSGLQTFNTQTGTSQTLAIGTSGTAPAWNSATNTHTLNIPMASTASVTAGLLSKTDYDAFNAKLGTGTTFSGDVSGAYNATSVDKIKGKSIAANTYAAGQTLRYDGTDWINSVLNFADLGAKPTTLAGYGITDAQSSALADGKIFVGNSSNVATAVTMSGDATLSNSGALTLATVPISKGGTGVTSFTGDKLVTTSAAGALQTSSCALGEVISFTAGGAITCAPNADATKLPLAGGTMTGAIDMGGQNLTNLGFVTMAANKNFHLSNNASDPTGLVAADKGKIWFNSTTGEIKYWNGSAAQPLGIAGSGLQTFNTQTGTTQTLAIGSTGTAPTWNSASNTHTLNLPMASTASVTAGLLSKTDYDAFNAKLGTATSFAGDVTGTSSALSVDKIKGKTVSATTYAAGQTLRYDGTNWVNAVLGFADLGSKPTTLAGYGITDAQSSTLADGKILIGNGSNVATAVTMSGDATLSNAGALTLATVPISKGGTGVTSFTGDKVITTSAAGALQATSCALNQVISFTAGGAITCATPNAGTVTSVTSASSYLSVATGTTTPVITANVGTTASTLAAGDDARFTDSRAPSGTAGGDLSGTYPSPTVAKIAGKSVVLTTPASGEVLKYDGTNFVNASGGMQTFNSQTGATQTLAIGTSGTAPAWNSATNTHTLNIPMASTASVTAGLLSKTDYDTFSAKLNAGAAFAGDVSGTYGATSVDKIKGKSIAATTYSAGQTLRYDGTNWINSVLNFADLSSTPTTLAGYGITDAQSSTLANGKILVGNGSNVATAVTMSGDAILSNTGAITLATVPVSKGGTGQTSFTGNKVITTSAAGALQASSCALNEVISFTAGGAITCANVNTLSGGFVNGGNSLGAAATLGTNDAHALNFETNNVTYMTLLSGGNFGIGTTNPGAPLHVKGTAAFESATVDINGPNFSLWKSRNYNAVQNNDELGYISSWGHDGTQLMRSAYILTSVDGTVATNSVPSRIQLATTKAGASSPSIKMTILSSGNVGIGSSNPSSKLDVNQTTAGGTALLAEDAGTVFWKVLNPAGGATNTWNTANAIEYIGKDTGTNRSINAAGTINASGADFAEWVDWSGPKPEMGSVILYRGSYVVVSSPFTAAFIGNDVKDPERSILVAFAGQLPVKIRGVVNEGDLVIAGENGEAKAVSKATATFEDSQKAVGTAWASSKDPGLKRVHVAVGLGLIAGSREIASLKNENHFLKEENVAKGKELEAVKARLDRLEKALLSVSQRH